MCDKRVCIVGGGIMGCSTAYYLTKRGWSHVTVVEAVEVAHAASGRAGGFLALNWCDRQGPVKELARRGFQLHSGLSEELGADIGFRRVKTLSLGVKERKSNSQNKKAGEVPSWVDGNVESCDEIGTHQTTAQVHPALVTRAFMASAEAKGAKVIRSSVKGLKLEGKSVTGVELDNGTIVEANIVVLTMGPWTGQGLEWLGKKSVVKGSRAHSILLRPESGRETAIDDTALFLAYEEEYKYKCLDPEVYPRPDGTVYVCGSGDKEPLPKNPKDVVADSEACAGLQFVASQVSSELKAAAERGVETSACFLPMSQDQQGPLIGAIPGFPSVYMAAGHYCWGILQGPATGETMAELITTGKTTIDITSFSPTRLIK